MTSDKGDGVEKHALVVEDDPEISMMLSMLLKREGMTVTVADDGNMALERINDMPPPNIILMDIFLPYLDGFQIVQAIKKKDGWQNVPIIMLTSQSQEKDIIRALEAGANDYVTKPFQTKELLARIKRFLA